MKRVSSMTLLRVACVTTLIALGLMAWGIVHPKPVPVMVAMSVGQALGTLAFLLFLGVVLRDLGPVLRGRAAPPPPPSLRPRALDMPLPKPKGTGAKPDAPKAAEPKTTEPKAADPKPDAAAPGDDPFPDDL